MLDLVALATVVDAVPLTGVNRALVRQGLAVMSRRQNLGIAALADVSRLAQMPEAWHLGFVGPRVNAGGRVGEAGLGVKLTTTDVDEAAGIATRLDQYNSERREIEAAVLEAAMAQAEQQAEADAPLIVAASEGWHRASSHRRGRIKEAFNRPACVVSFGNGVGKGPDGRYVRGPGLAVIAAHQAGHLINGGGHAMAAGFTVAEERLIDFRRFLTEHIENQLEGTALSLDIGIDALSPEGATVEIIESLNEAGPFGASNPRLRRCRPSRRSMGRWDGSPAASGPRRKVAHASNRSPFGRQVRRWAKHC